MPLQVNDRINPPTTAQLLTDLRATAQKLGQNTITRQQYRQYGNHYPTRYISTFGSWNKALLQAGLQIKKQYNVAVPDPFANLRQLWNALGRQPTTTDLYPPSSRSGIRPYLRAFRTWTNALTQFVASENNTTAQRPRSTNHPNKKTTHPQNHYPPPPLSNPRSRKLPLPNLWCLPCPGQYNHKPPHRSHHPHQQRRPQHPR